MLLLPLQPVDEYHPLFISIGKHYINQYEGKAQYVKQSISWTYNAIFLYQWYILGHYRLSDVEYYKCSRGHMVDLLTSVYVISDYYRCSFYFSIAALVERYSKQPYMIMFMFATHSGYKTQIFNNNKNTTKTTPKNSMM